MKIPHLTGRDSAVPRPDPTRRVPVVDPDDRELWISLGGALENLLVAAEHYGYQTETTYHLTGTARCRNCGRRCRLT